MTLPTDLVSTPYLFPLPTPASSHQNQPPSHQPPVTSNQPPSTIRSSVRLVTCLLLAPLLPAAQDRPQFIWQGEVDGIDILYLHSATSPSRPKRAHLVTRQQYHFYDRLPDSHQDVRLEVREGRGFVHIVDQPRLENHYTLAVSIEDRQPGSSFYSIALYWDASNQAFERGPGRTTSSLGAAAWMKKPSSVATTKPAVPLRTVAAP